MRDLAATLFLALVLSLALLGAQAPKVTAGEALAAVRKRLRETPHP